MDVEPTMGAEDFSFMLQRVPGTYFSLVMAIYQAHIVERVTV